MNIVMITPDAYMIDRRIILEAKTLIKAGNSVALLAGFECKEEEHYTYEGIDIYRYVYDWDDERLKKIRAKLPDNDRIKMLINRVFMFVAKRVFSLTPFETFMASKLAGFEADVIHVHDLPCLKVGLSVSQKKGIPLVYDAHELYYAQDVLSKKLQKSYFKLEKKYIRRAEAVITVNPFIAKLMAERYLIRQPYVIMNCTEMPKNFDTGLHKSLLREKGHIPAEWKIVLYQGWISAERNIETLVKGVKYFPPKTGLAIIGYGDYEAVLKSMAKADGIEDKVFFLGKVQSEDMLKFTVGADLGVIPYRPIDDNHLYCSPNKLFEYVLAGVPTITDKLPFFELIQSHYNFVVLTDMGSAEAFGKKVNQILKDNDLLELLKKNCSKAAQELNWDQEGEKLLDMYENLRH